MHRTQDLGHTGRRSSAAARWALAALVPMFVPLVLALTAGPASAQVIRCTDAKTGRVTYTNSSCKDGENRVQVQEAPSPEELERERAQSAAAIERKNQQLAREEAERRTRAQQQEREARSRRERENSAQRDGGDSRPASRRAAAWTPSWPRPIPILPPGARAARPPSSRWRWPAWVPRPMNSCSNRAHCSPMPSTGRGSSDAPCRRSRCRLRPPSRTATCSAATTPTAASTRADSGAQPLLHGRVAQSQAQLLLQALVAQAA